MRIIVLTQYYPPEIGAPQNRLSDLARRLVRMGHQVTVLTAMPNYPTGRIHEGYRRRVYMRETIDGVLVYRGWIYASTSRKVVPRLLNYFSFVLSSLIAGAFFLRRADFLLVESPPLFLGISGYFLAKLKRARLLLNVADLWPKAAVDMKVISNKSLINAAERFENLLYRKASLIIAQTQGIMSHIKERAPQKKVCLLTNGADPDQFGPNMTGPRTLKEFGLEGCFIIGYAGLHGPAQALEKVIDAAQHLRSFPNIVLAFFGEGPHKSDLQKRVREKGLKNVRFFPLQSRKRMPGLIASWDIGLVPLYNSPLMRGALPSKMFEVMAAGVPVLLSAPPGEASAVIESAQAGVCVKSEGPQALAEAIIKLYGDEAWRKQLGRNARAYVKTHYNRQIIAEQFLQYLLQLGGRVTPSPKAITA